MPYHIPAREPPISTLGAGCAESSSDLHTGCGLDAWSIPLCGGWCGRYVSCNDELCTSRVVCPFCYPAYAPAASLPMSFMGYFCSNSKFLSMTQSDFKLLCIGTEQSDYSKYVENIFGTYKIFPGDESRYGSFACNSSRRSIQHQLIYNHRRNHIRRDDGYPATGTLDGVGTTTHWMKHCFVHELDLPYHTRGLLSDLFNLEHAILSSSLVCVYVDNWKSLPVNNSYVDKKANTVQLHVIVDCGYNIASMYRPPTRFLHIVATYFKSQAEISL